MGGRWCKPNKPWEAVFNCWNLWRNECGSAAEHPPHGALEPSKPQLGLLDPELVWDWLAAEVKSTAVGSHVGTKFGFCGELVTRSWSRAWSCHMLQRAEATQNREGRHFENFNEDSSMKGLNFLRRPFVLVSGEAGTRKSPDYFPPLCLGAFQLLARCLFAWFNCTGFVPAKTRHWFWEEADRQCNEWCISMGHIIHIYSCG